MIWRWRPCFSVLGDVPRARVAAIGDSLRTDIAGANAVGADFRPAAAYDFKIGVGADHGQPMTGRGPQEILVVADNFLRAERAGHEQEIRRRQVIHEGVVEPLPHVEIARRAQVVAA